MSDERFLNINDIAGRQLPGFLVVEGPIGVGKTTLTRMLAELFNCPTLLEAPHENPFLERFYAGEKNAALSTQLFFLMQRAQQISQLRHRDLFAQHHVSDFLLEKDRLFAEVTLDDDELALYRQVYEHMTIDAPVPDLVVYLQAPAKTLLERIQHRGVAAEQSIDKQYLDRLNEAYLNFFHYYDRAPLLIVNAESIDWVNNPNDFNNLVNYLLNVDRGRHYYNPQSAL